MRVVILPIPSLFFLYFNRQSILSGGGRFGGSGIRRYANQPGQGNQIAGIGQPGPDSVVGQLATTSYSGNA